MKFGFVVNVLKAIGKAAVPVLETTATTAATAAGGPLLGALVPMIFDGVRQAAAKHGNVPNTAVLDDSGITVGQAKKFDVMQLLESNGAEIASLILSGTKKKVIDRDRFVRGTDKITEGVVDVLKSIGELPTESAATDPVVITPAVVELIKAAPAPAPSTEAVIHNLDPIPGPKAVDPLEIAAMLSAVVAKLQGR